MIDPRARILLLLFGLAVLVLVVNLVRKRQLQERYALLWLLAGLALVLAPLFVDGIDRLAAWLGFEYPPALLLMLAVVGLMLIIAQLSLAISGQADRIKILTQELGLLRAELAEIKAKFEGQAGQDDSSAGASAPQEGPRRESRPSRSDRTEP